MTPTETTLPFLKPRARPAVEVAAVETPALRTLRVSWFSQGAKNGGADNRRFVFDVEWPATEVASPLLANVEAWVERDGARSIVFARRCLKAHVAAIDGMLHIDIVGDNGDGRIAAISLLEARACGEHLRLLYAQTSLLTKFGFAAGSYDPPAIIG